LNVETEDASAPRHVPGSQDPGVRHDPHPHEHRQQPVPEMKCRRRKILKQPSANLELAGPFGKYGERQDREGQHRGRAGGADVPRVPSAEDTPGRVKSERAGPHSSPAQAAARQLRDGLHGPHVLRLQAGTASLCAHIRHMQIAAQQAGEGGGTANKGSAA
jgi:hypothetical protein